MTASYPPFLGRKRVMRCRPSQAEALLAICHVCRWTSGWVVVVSRNGVGTSKRSHWPDHSHHTRRSYFAAPRVNTRAISIAGFDPQRASSSIPLTAMSKRDGTTSTTTTSP